MPEKPLGRLRAPQLHDHLVARALPKLADRIDIVHAWPLGALRTLEAARRLGIPTVLERPNAHTRFAYEVVEAECRRLGVMLPPGHEHAYNEAILRREEGEYELADWLLCPSDFVVRTFLDQGFPAEKLVRHDYGYDDAVFGPRCAAQRARGPHGSLRRRLRGSKGPSLRARGLAGLRGELDRDLPDRGGVPPRLRGGARWPSWRTRASTGSGIAPTSPT